MVLTRKFEVEFSEPSRKETDNLQLLLSVLPVHEWSFEFYLSIYLLIHSFGCSGSLLGRVGFSYYGAWALKFTSSVASRA